MHCPVGVATCSAVAVEVRRCCQELGVAVRLHLNEPSCLLEGARGTLSAVVGRAAEGHDRLILAIGQCCGDVQALGLEHRAVVVPAEACTEMLMGPGTYQWCMQHGVLLLPPGYFSTWLNRPEQDGTAEAGLASRIEAHDVRVIAAIGEGSRHPHPEGLRQVAALAGRETTPLHAGLGHIREALRAAAETAGLPLFTGEPRAIDPGALGPGDHCLLLSSNGSPPMWMAAELVRASMRHGVRCVWVAGEDPTMDLRSALAPRQADLQAWQDSGELQIVSADSIIADASADAEPRLLVDRWASLALDALKDGHSGLCVIHGCGWAEAAGLDTEYLLEYSSRLSAACSEWPILAAQQACGRHYSPHILDELIRTHPLLWSQAGVVATSAFRRSDEYLGGQTLLEALSDPPAELDCQELAVLVSALADGQLAHDAASAIAWHVDGCRACQQLVESSESIRSTLQSLRMPQTRVPADLWPRVRNALDSDA